MARIYVLHENEAWVRPLRAAFAELGLAYAEWFVDSGTVDLAAPPPDGVFYNRMSASSHSRGHRWGPEHAATLLSWLESHGRTVVNGWRAVQLEVSKAAQYAALARFGITTPRTLVVTGRTRIAAAAAGLFEALEGAPVLIKPNRGGRGLGVRLFDTPAALAAYVESEAYEPPLDGTVLLQEYVRAPEPFITRCEFVGGEFLYAVRVDASDGFELCPADVCQADDAPLPAGTPPPRPKFEIIENFTHPLLDRYRAFLGTNDIGIAGVEFVADAAGHPYTYDVNTNTNYNPEAETRAGVSGMHAVARYLGDLLAR
ncbi:MAG: RimK family alpha-L-glutamate ligase, partial [Kiloniellales bacterium]